MIRECIGWQPEEILICITPILPLNLPDVGVTSDITARAITDRSTPEQTYMSATNHTLRQRFLAGVCIFTYARQ